MKREKARRHLHQFILSECITNVRLPLAKTQKELAEVFLDSLYKLHFGVLWHAAATESRQR